MDICTYVFSCVCVGLNVSDDGSGGGVGGSTNGRSFVHNRSWWWKLNKLFGLFYSFSISLKIEKETQLNL